MDEETKGTLKLMTEKLNELLVTLKRIEERQITVREEIKEQTAPVIGSFGSRE